MKAKLSSIVTNAHLISEKCVHIAKVNKEKIINKKISEIWAGDKDTILNGYRNGTPLTQHGVNAEYQYIAAYNIEEIRKATEENRDPVLMFKSPEVNGPDDMVCGGAVYQAKYYKTTKGSLDACAEHMEKYEANYGAGTNSFYVIPPEQYEDILAIMDSKIPEGYSAVEARNIKNTIEALAKKRGLPVKDFIKAGSVTRKESEIDNVGNTVMETENKIEQTRKENEEKAALEALPSVSKMFKQAGISALIAGLFSVYNRISEDKSNGKNIFAGDYGKEDYIELSKNAAKSGAFAATGSCVVYGINAVFTKAASPAVMFYKIAKDIGTLALNYKTDKISIGDFYEKACTNTSIIMLNALGETYVNMATLIVFDAITTAAIINPAIASFVFSMAAGMVLSYLVNVGVEYVKENFGPKIKEFISYVTISNKSEEINMLEVEEINMLEVNNAV